jgi:hypothetical protein
MSAVDSLKFILPMSVRKAISRLQYRIFGLEHQYKRLKSSEVFNVIYRNGVWGQDHEGNSTSGNGSHNNEIMKLYIKRVKEILQKDDLKVVVDLGCGYFNVGKNFVEGCERYIACDSSKVIFDRKKIKFNLDKVEFRNIDLAQDELPSGDIAFVRQVLQHLSNDDILRFAKQISVSY